MNKDGFKGLIESEKAEFTRNVTNALRQQTKKNASNNGVFSPSSPVQSSLGHYNNMCFHCQLSMGVWMSMIEVSVLLQVLFWYPLFLQNIDSK